MICQNCLAQLSQDAKFCENCGTKAEGYEYPRTELSSSGPMQYKKTNLDIARLDLSSVRIDLNKQYSKYVIPTTDTYSGAVENDTPDAVINKSADKNNNMPYVNPQRARVYANTVSMAPAPDMPKNANPAQKNLNNNTATVNSAQYQDRRYTNMANHNMPNQNMQQMHPNYRNMHTAKQSSPQPQNDKQEIMGVVWFVLSLLSMSFLGAPVLSAIISVIVLINVSKLNRSVKLKNVAIGISMFVFVMSLFSILANSGL